MNSNNDRLTIKNSTFAQRQVYASSLKAYEILADFEGLLIAKDHNNLNSLFISDRINGRIVGIDYKGQGYDIDGFKWIWSIHLDNLRNRIYDCCPSWYEREFDKPNKGLIKEVIQFIKDNHPSNKV